MENINKQNYISFPTSTAVRKIGTTIAARSLGVTENELICKQMSHQPSVSSRFDKATCGAQDAAHAMDGLMQGEQRPTLDTKVNARWTKWKHQ